MADIRIEYRDLATLLRAPRNPKGHDLGAIQSSLVRFGFVAPIIVDDATGRLVAGHGRVDALQQRKASGQPPPARVKVEGDRWLVPVVAGVSFGSPVEAESYLVADNQTTMLGAWDDQELAALLGDLAAQDALAGTGFDQKDVDALLQSLAEKPLAEDESGRLKAAWEIIVTCRDEAHQLAMLERLTGEGLQCKALIS